MSAMQHRLEWSQAAFTLLSFAQMWSTGDAVTNLKLTLRLQGIRHLSNLLRPVYLEGCEDPFGKTHCIAEGLYLLDQRLFGPAT